MGQESSMRGFDSPEMLVFVKGVVEAAIQFVEIAVEEEMSPYQLRKWILHFSFLQLSVDGFDVLRAQIIYDHLRECFVGRRGQSRHYDPDS